MPGLKHFVVKKLGLTISPFGLRPEEEGEVSCGVSFQPSHTNLPSKVDLRKYCSEVESQGATNSCTANAVVGAMEYLSRREGCSGDLSRLFVYYMARVKGKKNPMKDNGSSISLAIEALKECGACTEETWPFEKKLVNTKPSEEAQEEAKRFTISKAVEIPVDQAAMKECLASGYPFVFGLKLTEKFKNPGPKGIIYTPSASDPKAAQHGLHAMMAVGYSDKQKVFIVRNSWGPTWGDKGYCYIPYDYMFNPGFNCCKVWSIHSMSDTDFAMEGDEDDEDVVDWDDNEEIDDDVEEYEEEEEEGEEDEGDGDDDGAEE